MALTLSQVLPGRYDKTFHGQIAVVDVTFDSSYATGGEAFDPATFGFSEVYTVHGHVKQNAGAGSYVLDYDGTNKKLQVFWVDTTVDGAALAEVVSTTDLSTVTFRVFVYGIR